MLMVFSWRWLTNCTEPQLVLAAVSAFGRDRLGMLVMDETFDMWLQTKSDDDYALAG